jgi:DNA repair exonuclease SbcCD ATPase subunit
MRRLILLLLLAVTASAGDRFPYVYSRDSSKHWTISRGNVEDIVRLTKRYSGAFVWARVDGREYLIRDAAVLDEVRRAARPLEELEPAQRSIERRMKPVERQQEKLEDELDQLTDKADDEALTAADHARIRDLRSQIRDLERQLHPLEQEERQIDEREEELDRVFDDEVERIVKRAIRLGTAERVN